MSSKVSVLLLAAAAISIVNCEVQGFSAPTPRRDVSGVNHFTSIGMPWSNNKELDTVDPMIEFCELVFADFKNIQIVDVNQDSHYQLYASKSGAQLWGETAKPQNGGNACFGGFVPHFQGESRVNVCILTRQDHPLAEFEDGTTSKFALCGTFEVMHDPDPENSGFREFLMKEIQNTGGRVVFGSCTVISTDPEEGMLASGMGLLDRDTMATWIAFNFDCPNYGFFARDNPGLPIYAKFQIAAIAHEIQTYKSEEEYYAKREKQLVTPATSNRQFNTAFASRYFGTQELLAREDKENPIKSEALFVGHVMKTEKKMNELTGESFYWALIETAGDMELDVVIHPMFFELTGMEPPKVGGVVQGYGWLSGKLILDDGLE